MWGFIHVVYPRVLNKLHYIHKFFLQIFVKFHRQYWDILISLPTMNITNGDIIFQEKCIHLFNKPSGIIMNKT